GQGPHRNGCDAATASRSEPQSGPRGTTRTGSAATAASRIRQDVQGVHRARLRPKLVYCFAHSGTLETVLFASWLGARRPCGRPHTTTSNNARARKARFISFGMGEAVH